MGVCILLPPTVVLGTSENDSLQTPSLSPCKALPWFVYPHSYRHWCTQTQQTFYWNWNIIQYLDLLEKLIWRVWVQCFVLCKKSWVLRLCCVYIGPQLGICIDHGYSIRTVWAEGVWHQVCIQWCESATDLPFPAHFSPTQVEKTLIWWQSHRCTQRVLIEGTQVDHPFPMIIP